MKLSKLIKQQDPCDGFPVIGKNGYAGEQNGDRVIFTDVLFFCSRHEADTMFPDGVPEYVQLHWGKYYPTDRGWECVFAWWASQHKPGDGNPLIGY